MSMDFEVDGVNARIRPSRTQEEVVEADKTKKIKRKALQLTVDGDE